MDPEPNALFAWFFIWSAVAMLILNRFWFREDAIFFGGLVTLLLAARELGKR